MTDLEWIAADWGTTNVRAWAMSKDGDILAEATSADGMGTLAPDGFEDAFARLTADWTLADRCPVLICGMAGARQGWTEAPYAAVPTAPDVTPPTPVDTRSNRWKVRILPGLSQQTPPDVMRGEETQIAGFLTLHPQFDGTLILPGSHTKWVQVSAGEIVSFQTAMTGEIYAALSGHTVLRHSVGCDIDPDAFAEAVSDGLSRPEALAARAFQLRADDLLHGLDPARATGRLSGLLVGAELAHARPYWLGMQTALIGASKLSQTYASALESQGVTPVIERGDACTLAGLRAAFARWKD